MEKSTVSMKLLIDSRSKRVLLAEASKETVDFLFQILLLPVATIVRLLKKRGMVGSLPNLYESLEKLNEKYILPNQNKRFLLTPSHPASISSVPLLEGKGSVTDRTFYRCRQHFNYGSHLCDSISDGPNAICPNCKQPMTMPVPYVAPPGKLESTEGGFVKEMITYMIMDDLEVKPMSTISSITLLNKFQVKDVGNLQEKEVTLGMDEAKKLLMASLQSETVLTDLFLKM